MDFQRPSDILLNFKALQRGGARNRREIKKGQEAKTAKCPVLSELLYEVRTYFEEKFCLQAENSIKNKLFL